MEKISVFDIFKIGIGPSSSHTMGPWRAALRFIRELAILNLLDRAQRIQVDLYGSLAKTGHGHGTDTAILLGLSGFDPVTIPEDAIQEEVAKITQSKRISPEVPVTINFDPATDLVFHYFESLPFHPNGLRFTASFAEMAPYVATYFSTGGGFVLKENEDLSGPDLKLPYPIQTSDELESYCSFLGKSIDEIVLQNERMFRTEEEIRSGLLNLFEVMLLCAYHGCHTEGVLPGGLKVSRRAAGINKKLLDPEIFYSDARGWLDAVSRSGQDFETINKWISCFALAVNEVNASFGRVVTAPTNGAAGVIPAVLLYHICFGKGKEDKDRDIIRFLLTAGEIGSIFKKGATISAAMGGCQAEIGVSSAMAAGGLALCLGGDYRQTLMAAEIAMEHHLGMTCDPVGGLVQIPCIERNTMGAIKAITAAHLALDSDPGAAKVSLDEVIHTMWQTALDMNSKYKETAEGGLAVNIAVNVAEC